MRFFAVALIFFGAAASYAQAPEVPHKMNFAGMTLIIRDDARREIQKDVDALTHNARYFEMKVERAKTYFPIIEKVFAEERLPNDFKYLVLQESALVADAVSVSNAVGFWQFKDFTAREMGLRVDKEIDERMNIASASRGAAKYLKQNNYYFNNWVYALQAYQMGAGGVQRSVGEDHHGASKMEINSETYWYVKKFLAYKVAFENAVKGDPQVKISTVELSSKSVADLAKELTVEENSLREFNKWIKGDRIPQDKNYTVVIPGSAPLSDFNKLVLTSNKASRATPSLSTEAKEVLQNTRKEINGSWAIMALPSETLAALAQRSKITLSDLLRYNDISIDHRPMAGGYYFIEKKKTKGLVPVYTSKLGDDLWTISQHFGVRLKKVKKYNKGLDQVLLVGTTVWLQSDRPLEGQVAEVAELEEDSSFEWSVTTEKLTQPSSKKAEGILDTEDSVKILPVLEKKEVNEPILIAEEHSVQKGESLYSISKLYQLKVSDLEEWNNLNLQVPLKESQKLRVKPPIVLKDTQSSNTSNDGVIIHEVKANETIFSVARQYQVTIKELMEWNGKNDFVLAVGEKLKIMRR